MSETGLICHGKMKSLGCGEDFYNKDKRQSGRQERDACEAVKQGHLTERRRVRSGSCWMWEAKSAYGGARGRARRARTRQQHQRDGGKWGPGGWGAADTQRCRPGHLERSLTRMPSNRDRARSGRRARRVRRALMGAMSEYCSIFAMRLVSEI